MKCEKCGAELPANAKFCDLCGAKVFRETYEERAAREAAEREKEHRKKLTRKITVASVLLILIAAAWSLFWPRDRHYAPDIYSLKDPVTAEEYGMLYKGMTYKQVTDTIGKGARESRWGNVLSGFDIYIWPGEFLDKGVLYSEVSVYIDRRSKKVDMFSESNVVNGKEIHDNLSGSKKAVTRRTREEIEAMESGLTYQDVADFMGAEGILTESESNSNGNNEKTYVWYIYDEYGSSTGVYVNLSKNKVSDINII